MGEDHSSGMMHGVSMTVKALRGCADPVQLVAQGHAGKGRHCLGLIEIPSLPLSVCESSIQTNSGSDYSPSNKFTLLQCNTSTLRKYTRCVLHFIS